MGSLVTLNAAPAVKCAGYCTCIDLKCRSSLRMVLWHWDNTDWQNCGRYCDTGTTLTDVIVGGTVTLGQHWLTSFWSVLSHWGNTDWHHWGRYCHTGTVMSVSVVPMWQYRPQWRQSVFSQCEGTAHKNLNVTCIVALILANENLLCNFYAPK